MAWNIARAKKPDNEGELVKKCLCDAIEILSPENNKLKKNDSRCPTVLPHCRTQNIGH